MTGKYRKEAWTFVEETPTCPYSGSIRSGFTIGVPGREMPLVVSGEQARLLRKTLRTHIVVMDMPMSESACRLRWGYDRHFEREDAEWMPTADLHFRNAATTVLQRPLSLRESICLQGVFYGEGVLTDMETSPSWPEICRLRTLLGRKILAEAERNIMAAELTRLRIGRGFVGFGLRKLNLPGFDPKNVFHEFEQRLGASTDGALELADESFEHTGDMGQFSFISDEAVFNDMVARASACGGSRRKLLEAYRQCQYGDAAW